MPTKKMTNEMDKQQKLNAIMTDILDRDQDSFVKIRRTGRLGWESLIPQGGNYSDILLGLTKVEDIVKVAYGMARDYIVAMDTPYKVLLRLSPEMNCTDSRVVYLATEVFDDPALTDAQKIDTFVGLAVHEGCHLKWTDFTPAKAELDSALVRNLTNIIEDERIERLCGEHMPGYANFLKAAKYYMFDLYCSRLAAAGGGKTLDEGSRLLNAIISLVRFPRVINRDDALEFADPLYEVREVLADFPEDQDGVLAAALKIYDIIKGYFEKKSRDSSDEGTGSGDDGSGDSSSADGEESGRKEENESGEGSSAGSGNSGEQSQGEEQTPGSGTTSEESVAEEVRAGMDRMEEAAMAMGDLTSDPGEQEPLSADQMAGCVSRDSCQLAGICEDAVTLGQTSQSVLYRAPENAVAYDQALSKVRRYIPAIARSLKGHCSEYQVTYHGMRSGLLDTGKLAEAYQGVQNVYIRSGKVKSDSMAVCVLIDESGSMYGEKINAARSLAVLLNEAISGIPAIDLYIYGHTYGDRCRDSYRAGNQVAELQVYREKGYAPKKALGSVESRSGNLDSFAIREAAARMRKYSACGKNLMFVITDGAPNERYEQLTATVRRLEKEGMNIVAVCIEPDYDPSRLYTHHVKFTDMTTLAIDLGRMIKKAILTNANRHNE